MLHVFGLWGETGAARGILRRHRENMQNPLKPETLLLIFNYKYKIQLIPFTDTYKNNI